MKSIENNATFENKFKSAMSDPEKASIIKNIRKYLEIIMCDLTNYIKDESPDKSLFVKLVNSVNIRKFQFDHNHILVSQNRASFFHIKSIKTLFVFIFLLLSFYECMIFDILLVWRFILYLLKYHMKGEHMFDHSFFYQTSKKLILSLKINPNATKINIVKKSRASAAGAFIIEHENGTVSRFDERSDLKTLDAFNQHTHKVIVSANVKAVIICESEAFLVRFMSEARIKRELFHSKSLIVIQTSGQSDLNVLSFISYLSKLHPSLIFFSLNDCDWYGLGMKYIFKHGSQNNISINCSLTVPHIVALGLFSYQYENNSNFFWSQPADSEKMLANSRLRHLQPYYDYQCDAINDAVLFLFKNKSASLGGSSDISAFAKTVFNILEKFTTEELCSEAKNGASYYQFNEKFAFEMCDSYIISSDEIQSLRCHIPNNILDKFAKKFNKLKLDEVIGMHSINYLVKSNESFEIIEKNQMQIYQLHDLAYALVVYFPKEKTVNVYCLYQVSTSKTIEETIDIVAHRYNVGRGDINVIANEMHNSDCANIFFSGMWAVVWAIDYIVYGKPKPREQTIKRNDLANWFLKVFEENTPLVPFQ